jgi:uncharacterized protein
MSQVFSPYDETAEAPLMPADTTQAEVFRVLRDPAAWPGHPDRVEVIETHGAVVFMAGETALKVKRAVKLAYLDFSTLDARRRYCEREIEINRPHAPEIYRDVISITRKADGQLVNGGAGEPIEWAVRMRRFAQDDLLSHRAEHHEIDANMARNLAQMVVAMHRAAPLRPDATDATEKIITSVLGALSVTADPRILSAVTDLERSLMAALARSAAIRLRRAHHGYLRRCHGDLHLRNIVLWQGRPVPFDAIEFDEDLATVDTLYDLAFLLMDLERRGARSAANLVLDRYLWQTGDPIDLEGLAALPVFLGLRAAIRAMVALDRVQLGAARGSDPIPHILDTLALAQRLSTPPPARLVAIGGFSGTGKTTLAAALAPTFGAALGALHVRTDLERKWLAGVGELDRLPEAAYTPDAAAAVYARVTDRARLALMAGHSVIVDGVFARSNERSALAQLAEDAGVVFQGLWLDATPDVLRSRVSTRTSDASDATSAVVDTQLSVDTGPIDWTRIDSCAAPATVRGAAIDALTRASQASKPTDGPATRGSAPDRQ